MTFVRKNACLKKLHIHFEQLKVQFCEHLKQIPACKTQHSESPLFVILYSGVISTLYTVPQTDCRVRTHSQVRWSNQRADGFISFNTAAGVKSEIKLFQDAFRELCWNESKLSELEQSLSSTVL